MSVDQFRAYRQTGMYGAYRLAFRKWPGMTMRGDGWAPGPATNNLAKWLDEKMGAARPDWPLHVGDGDDDGLSTRSAKLRRGEEHKWWLQQWKTFDHVGRNADENTLPRRKDDFAILPEANRLKPLIFEGEGRGQRRLEVAREVAKAPATDNLGICEHLSTVFAGIPAIALLPRFTRLADAGMAAMDLVAKTLDEDGRAALVDVAALPSAAAICEELMTAAHEWGNSVGMQLRHLETADRFVSAIRGPQPLECLRGLLQHHEVYGGGLRWFVLRNGCVEPRTPQRSGSSRYRFRLWSLCRLATQCGVLRTCPRLTRGR